MRALGYRPHFPGLVLVLWAKPSRCEALYSMHHTIGAAIDPLRDGPTLLLARPQNSGQLSSFG
jgi:hypothetical protein